MIALYRRLLRLSTQVARDSNPIRNYMRQRIRDRFTNGSLERGVNTAEWLESATRHPPTRRLVINLCKVDMARAHFKASRKRTVEGWSDYDALKQALQDTHNIHL
jgi:hypothetical protein